MHVSSLILCDAATVREGLINVIGGGLTYIRRPSYPAPLVCDIALTISHRGSADIGLKVVLRKDGEPQPLSEFELEGVAEASPEMPRNAYTSTSFAIDARALAIPGPGDYTFTATVKGGKGMTVSFGAQEDPSLENQFSVR
ncbi:DUF6941 family protein [Microbacterium sp. ZW T5_45]|uniref:DUF6941 family protein n=1 Tax=Microbacterium sp. ZW T5_45 TaxID=3378080 RepID=UPI0038547252